MCSMFHGAYASARSVVSSVSNCCACCRLLCCACFACSQPHVRVLGLCVRVLCCTGQLIGSRPCLSPFYLTRRRSRVTNYVSRVARIRCAHQVSQKHSVRWSHLSQSMLWLHHLRMLTTQSCYHPLTSPGFSCRKRSSRHVSVLICQTRRKLPSSRRLRKKVPHSLFVPLQENEA